MRPETKDKIFQLEISLAIIIVLVTILSFFKPSITGFVPASVYTEQLDIMIDSNTAFTVFSNQDMQLTSFKISGQVIGDGKAYVYLSNAEDQNLLIYNNMRKKEFGNNLITGMAVANRASEQEEQSYSLVIQEIPEFNEDIAMPAVKNDNVPYEEYFDNACVDTCSILMDLSNQKVYKLIVMLEENTKLKLDRIAYTINGPAAQDNSLT